MSGTQSTSAGGHAVMGMTTYNAGVVAGTMSALGQPGMLSLPANLMRLPTAVNFGLGVAGMLLPQVTPLAEAVYGPGNLGKVISAAQLGGAAAGAAIGRYLVSGAASVGCNSAEAGQEFDWLSIVTEQTVFPDRIVGAGE